MTCVTVWNHGPACPDWFWDHSWSRLIYCCFQIKKSVVTVRHVITTRNYCLIIYNKVALNPAVLDCGLSFWIVVVPILLLIVGELRFPSFVVSLECNLPTDICFLLRPAVIFLSSLDYNVYRRSHYSPWWRKW